jgi:hypothetical protein
MTNTPPPDDPAWAQVRLRYEQDQETVAAIALDMGMAGISLSKLAKAWGWRLRGKLKAVAKKKKQIKLETTAATVKRLKDILQKRVTQVENQLKEIGADVSALATEREIRSTNTLVRTLEKVLDLERKDRRRNLSQARDFKYFDDAQRGALADKIEKLQHEWRGDESLDSIADQGGSGTEQSVALLGEAEQATASSRD